MSMFKDLQDATLQPERISIDIPEIHLSLQMRNRLQAVFEEEEKAARINSTTSIVQPDSNIVFFSNHWFYLAVLCRKYAMALYPYCSFFDSRIRNNQTMTRDLAAEKYDSPQFAALFDNTEDMLRMISFIKGGTEYRPGKALLNNPDGQGVKTRSCKDIFGSCVLKKLAVPDASSNYLGTLIYYLAKREDLYEDLETEMNNEAVIVNTVEDSPCTIDALGDILRKMYDSPKASGQVASIHMFAFKYGKHIIENSISVNEIIVRAGINPSYNVELNKGLNIYRSVLNNEYGVRFYKEDDVSSPTEEDDSAGIARGGINRIYYGAPGSGKSHFVSSLLEEASVKDENIVRVTFHPEYSNVDFTGQILPTITTDADGEKRVEYTFNPGPFTHALLRAYNEPNDMVYLIIEEINRGNAAAIFGDMFQLLDRVRDSGKPEWSSSEYPVSNPNMQEYLKENVTSVSIRQRLCNGIYIPGNLTILATMNSSDQNVFTLDTAFKRRWDFEQISNDIEKDEVHSYKNWFVPGTDVTWAVFLTAINNEILKYRIHNQTNEDKRLGKYFVTRDCLTEHASSDYTQDIKAKASAFAYKVLEYIWNDVCKIGREEWFDTDKYQTLEMLIDAFVNPSEGETPLSVFRNISF